MINPKSVWFETSSDYQLSYQWYRAPFNYAKILLALYGIQKITVSSLWAYYNCSLSFSDVVIQIGSKANRIMSLDGLSINGLSGSSFEDTERKDSSIFKWSKVFLEFNIADVCKTWNISSHSSGDETVEFYLHIGWWKTFHIENFEKLDSHIINNHFPEEVLSKSDLEIIIPLKKLVNIEFFKDLLSTVKILKEYTHFIQYLQKAKTVKWAIEFGSLEWINEIVSILPSFTEYSLSKKVDLFSTYKKYTAEYIK